MLCRREDDGLKMMSLEERRHVRSLFWVTQVKSDKNDKVLNEINGTWGQGEFHRGAGENADERPSACPYSIQGSLGILAAL